MAFRHVVMFRFTDSVSREQRRQIVARIRSLPHQIGTIRSLSVGLDVGVSEDNLHLVSIVDFDDRNGYTHFASHPAHLGVVECLRPLLTERKAVQYETL